MGGLLRRPPCVSAIYAEQDYLLWRGTCGTIRTRAFRRVICSVAWRSGSAGALQAQGRGFKSLRDHHRNLRKTPDELGFFLLVSRYIRLHFRQTLADECPVKRSRRKMSNHFYGRFWQAENHTFAAYVSPWYLMANQPSEVLPHRLPFSASVCVTVAIFPFG